MRHLILATAFLSGCSSVVPTGIARLSAVSPMEADPAAIAVALALPDGVGIVENSAVLRLNAMRNDTKETSEESYILAEFVGSDGSQVYAVAPTDHKRLRQQQAMIRDWKTENEDATAGSLGVTLEGCTIGDGPSESATVSINIRTSADGAFFPLVRNASVTDVLQQAEVATLVPCP